jgi:hypothetical protein
MMAVLTIVMLVLMMMLKLTKYGQDLPTSSSTDDCAVKMSTAKMLVRSCDGSSWYFGKFHLLSSL